MACALTFTTAASLRHRHRRRTPARPLKCTTRRTHSSPISSATSPQRTSVTDEQADNVPPAGFSGKVRPTGTFCANLWPIPVFGRYGWFLTVYERQVAARSGAMVVQFLGDGAARLRFRPDSQPDIVANSKHINGIATGNLNVRAALKALGDVHAPHELRLFERGGAEWFQARRGELSLLDSRPLATSIVPFRVASRTDAYELRVVYSGAGAGDAPKAPPVLEYFAMNLFPIPILAGYSAFVAVWKQQPDTAPLAIERSALELRVGPLLAFQLDEDPVDKPGAHYAVASFTGAVSDAVVAMQHRALLEAVNATPKLSATANDCFRIVVDSTPNTLTKNRSNEIWIEVKVGSAAC